ncbi:MAG: L,D-transpeptidase family protein [Xanthomonadales bacterium]|nr:L,D-transpeptidase family protein [Xanthomonadales bacterium]
MTRAQRVSASGAPALLLALLTVILAACVGPGGRRTAADAAWNQCRQMVLVLTDGWDAPRARMFSFERSAASWHAVAGPFPVTLGRAGSAWGRGLHPLSGEGPAKREGDGRSPAGVFAIGSAFGSAPSVNSALEYLPMHAGSWCVDVSDSPNYNRIVDTDLVGAAAAAGASERMRLDLLDAQDQRYRLGFVIEHNVDQQPMGGSCIFAHLWKDADTPTAGCTAMAPDTMQQLLAWLDPVRKPVFVLLPEAAYWRLQAAWNLPRIGPAS